LLTRTPTHLTFSLSQARPPPRSPPFPYTTLFRSRLTFHNAAYRALWGLTSDFLDQLPSDGAVLDQLRAARKLIEHRAVARQLIRSEEHTSELQSRGHLVCRLLLEKKKKETRCLVC